MDAGVRITLITVIGGVLLIGLFRLVYPEAPIRSVVSIAAVISFIAAVLIDYLWRYMEKKRDGK